MTRGLGPATWDVGCHSRNVPGAEVICPRPLVKEVVAHAGGGRCAHSMRLGPPRGDIMHRLVFETNGPALTGTALFCLYTPHRALTIGDVIDALTYCPM